MSPVREVGSHERRVASMRREIGSHERRVASLQRQVGSHERRVEGLRLGMARMASAETQEPLRVWRPWAAEGRGGAFSRPDCTFSG